MAMQNDPTGRIKVKRKAAKEAYGSYGTASVEAADALQSLRRRTEAERSRSFKEMMPKHFPDLGNDKGLHIKEA